MGKPQHPQDDQVVDALRAFRDQTPQPDTARVAAAQYRFLSQARQIRRRQAVSHRAAVRHKEWTRQAIAKGRFRMTGLVKGLLVLALLSSSVTGTALAADASLPGQPLYPVDLMLEDVQEALILQPGALAQFEVRRVEERAYELNTMAERGRVPNAEQAERLRTQLQVALRATSRLEDAQMAQELVQFQTMAQQQTRQMTQLGLAQEAGMMTQAMVQVQYGLDDPAGFRAAFQLGNGPMNDNTPGGPQENVGGQDTVTPGPANGAGNGAQQGNSATMTPGPHGNNNDPGNPNTDSETPAGNQQRSGQTATPAPEGNSSGPGPGNGQGQQTSGNPTQDNGGGTNANPGGDNGNGGGNQEGGGH